MAQSPDVISNLAELSWRGKKAPCELAPLDGSHDQAERRYPYLNAAGHDHTGRAPYRFDAKLWFVNTILADSFPNLFQTYIEAVENGASGELIHPVRGKFQARVLNWKVDFGAKNRGGVSMDVTWVETIDDIEQGFVLDSLAVDPAAAAAEADRACQELGVEYPDGQSETSLLGAYNSIKGQLFSASLTVTGKINQISGIVGQLVEDVNAVGAGHAAYFALDNLTTFWSVLQDLKKQVEKTAARPTRSEAVANDTTLEAFASEKSNTLDEIMGLNLSALRSPIVPKGTKLTFYTA